MHRTELLAPAGSYEALVAAVQNGCDAIYLGGTSFGARAFAHNFTIEELQKGISYAHIYGVRVFVTVNTLIKEAEIPQCIQYIEQLQFMDVDALIVQDLGLLQLLHKSFPNMELHASTQMHIHNPQGIALVKEMGVSRVVLPRETMIEEIRVYHKLGLDLEVFVQGALCVSYSGQCLMSALTLQRSGNRGECAQNCRMKYTLEKSDKTGKHILKSDGDYLLSCKDLNTLQHVPELIEAGVYSFKIEGRMKRPEYVALMVSMYRKALDAYEQNLPFEVDAVKEEAMRKMFNRGFSAGHLFHETGTHLMNYHRPNHMGVEIGRVLGFYDDKVRIHLSKELYQGDGIRILTSKGDEGFTLNRMYKNGLLVNYGASGDNIEIDKTFFCDKGSIVVKTSDLKQLKEVKESYESNRRRVGIFGSFSMKDGSQACLEVMDEVGNQVFVQSNIRCEKARTMPLTSERIALQLQKSKDTPFDFMQISYELDGDSILPIKEINQMRRDALQQLAMKRTQCHGKRAVNSVGFEKGKRLAMIDDIIVIIHTMEQYKACVKAGITSIFVADNALYTTLKQDEKVKERTPRVMKQDYLKQFVMIQEAGGLYAKQPVLCDTSLNVTNSYTADFLFSQGAIGVCLSLENSLEECKKIVEGYIKHRQQEGNFIYPVYGREELMLSKYCVINAIEKDNGKTACRLCKQNNYALLDIKEQRYPLLCDAQCHMHILNAQARNRIQDIALAQSYHIHSFQCVFTIENAQECEEILSKIKKELSS